MIRIAIITPEERESLVGQYIYDDVLFNLDCKNIDDNYYVSELVVKQCNIEWIKSKPLIEYVPKNETLLI